MRARKIQRELVVSSGIADDALALVGAFDFTFFYVKNTQKDDKDSNSAQKYPYNGIDTVARKRWLKKGFQTGDMRTSTFQIANYNDL